ncbi:MAG: hypothetical protein V5B36_05560 [Candidatus Accumulibacter sp. UW25]|jgi:hypothetical protein
MSANVILPNDPTVKRHRRGKIAKLKPGENSFRPGQTPPKVAPGAGIREKTLVFIVPSSHPIGTLEEFGHIHGIATQIAEVPNVGEVTSIAIHGMNWEITLSLAIPDDMDDDAGLSNVFRALLPIIDGSHELRNGYRAGKPSRWEYRVGTFVADDGGF